MKELPRVAPDPAASRAPDAAPESLARFHEELRARSASVLTWSAWIFNTLYVAWSALDYVLARPVWQPFLILRVAVAGVGALIAFTASRARWRRYSWEALWIWLFLCGGGIAFMLPYVGKAFLPYLMGFTVILFGAG